MFAFRIVLAIKTIYVRCVVVVADPEGGRVGRVVHEHAADAVLARQRVFGELAGFEFHVHDAVRYACTRIGRDHFRGEGRRPYSSSLPWLSMVVEPLLPDFLANDWYGFRVQLKARSTALTRRVFLCVAAILDK